MDASTTISELSFQSVTDASTGNIGPRFAAAEGKCMSESALGENLGLLSQIGTGNEQEGTGNIISLIRPIRQCMAER